MIFVGIATYIFAALFIALWAYLTTKIAFSVFNRDRYILRIIAWLVVAWFLALVMYFSFVLAAGFLGVAVQPFLELIK